MYARALDLAALLRRRSLLLLGPRQTGKSTLLASQLPAAVRVDLLRADQYRQFSARPELLREVAREALRQPQPMLVVDEVQKIPALLDEAHALIAAHPELRLVLTGSSARKLRRAGTNLLGGRAARATLHPIVHPERGSDPAHPCDLARAMALGGLPAVLQSPEPFADLLDYVGVYLQEEIRAEGIARHLDAFARFLEVAALANGEQVVFARIGNDAQVPPRTVADHYQVLQDTLIGFEVAPFRATPTRKAVATPRFYFFDVGVVHALTGRSVLPAAGTEVGRALEHALAVELRACIDYRNLAASLQYWRSLSQLEVDFVVVRGGKPLLALEVKATAHVEARDLRGLRAFAQDWPDVPRVVACREPLARRTEDGIAILPVSAFLDQLWAGEWLGWPGIVGALGQA